MKLPKNASLSTTIVAADDAAWTHAQARSKWSPPPADGVWDEEETESAERELEVLILASSVHCQVLVDLRDPELLRRIVPELEQTARMMIPMAEQLKLAGCARLLWTIRQVVAGLATVPSEVVASKGRHRRAAAALWDSFSTLKHVLKFSALDRDQSPHSPLPIAQHRLERVLRELAPHRAAA